jgi:hypothetical protein
VPILNEQNSTNVSNLANSNKLVLGLEPTLANWFRITLLHVWMLSARWRLEEYSVNEMPQHIVDIFFKDVEMRMVEGKVMTNISYIDLQN